MKTLLAFLQMLFVSVTPTPVSPTPTPTPPPQVWTINYGAESYQIAMYKVQENDQVTLINNLTDKLRVSDLVKKNACKAGINGGFYDTSDKALGLMVVDGRILFRSRGSSLFNGFVGENLEVYDQPPKESNVTQTGPILMKGGRVQTLNLARDSYDRRMVVVNGTHGEAWLMAVYGQSAFGGPQLVDLGKIIDLVGEKYGLNITVAINMDGGSASAFVSPDVQLEEFNRVGSWWCVQGV